MTMRLLMTSATLLAASCVTPMDLRAIASDLEGLENGTMTRAETVASINALADEIEDRDPEIPTSPLDLVIYAVTAGAAMYGTKKIVDRSRDQARVVRGEKTG